MSTSHFVENAGVRLHYLDSGGDAKGAPIVFVPGMTDVAQDYLGVLAQFRRRTVIAELRGHGRSSAAAGGYDLDTLTGDVGAIIDAVTDGAVHIMTFSRGTTYAIGWCLRNPGRVRSLSIGDYVPEEKTVPPHAVKTMLNGRWRGSPVSHRLDRRSAEVQFAAARDRSFWESLAELQPPMLAVRAMQSPIVTDGDWTRYRRLFPAAQLVTFDDSPHDIFRPDRGRYPRLVADLADRADVASPVDHRNP